MRSAASANSTAPGNRGSIMAPTFTVASLSCRSGRVLAHPWHASTVRYRDQPTIEVTQRVRCDVATLWKHVTDITLPAQCSTELQSVEWLDGADGVKVGARFRGRSRHEAFGDWETVCEVVEVEDQRRWGLERHRPRRCRRDVGVRGGTGQRRRADPPVGQDGSGTVGTHSGNP